MDMKLLSERIQKARANLEIPPDALASAIGVNKSAISRYERGEIETPKMPVIQAIKTGIIIWTKNLKNK